VNTVNVYNMALGHLGAVTTISSTTEKSAEAQICNTFFQASLEATLRDYRLSVGKRVKALSLVEESPTDEWLYSYDYPNDCLFVRRILSGIHNDTNDSRVPYEEAMDANGRKLIYTNAIEAQVEFTGKITDLSILPADVILALSFRLSGYIAPVVTKGDPFKLGIRALQLYQVHIGKAVANAGNEQQPQQQPESDHIRSRM